MEEENLTPQVTDKPKKRKRNGSKKAEKTKKLLKSHVTGENCHCTRFNCFENTTPQDRSQIIAHFNELLTKDEQDSLLASHISCELIKRRRPRNDENMARFHDHSYQYSVNVIRNDNAVKLPVCVKAFQAIFGIGIKRIRRVRHAKETTGYIV